MRKLRLANADKAGQIVWKEILRSRESRYDHRLHGILFVCRGMSCYETAAVWGSSPRSVEYWVRKFDEKGLDGLWEKPRSGRPANLGGLALRRLRGELGRAPRDFGYAGRRWSGRLLRRHLAEVYRVDLSVRQCQRLLKGGAVPESH